LRQNRLLFVWRTPRLGRPSKWIATLLIVGGTVYLGHQLWQMLQAVRSLLRSVS